MKPIQSARAPWSSVIAVCRKCARKAGRERFAKELKSACKAEGRRKSMRVVEVGCLDLCPKRRLTVATGQHLAAGLLHILPPDTKARDALRLLYPGEIDQIDSTAPRP